MKRLDIRPARPADKDAVAALSAHIWEGEDYVPDTFDDWLADPQGQFSVAYEGNSLVGFAKLTRLGAGEWWMEGLRVHPAERGRGIARRLHHHVVDLADRLGSGVLRLATNARSEAVHHLAESTGFGPVCGYTGARVPAAAAGGAPGGLHRATADEAAAIIHWLEDSAYFAGAHGLYEEHWTWLSLKPRLAPLLADGLVYWWRPGARPAGVVILDPGTGEQTRDKPLRLSYLDGDLEQLPALTAALQALAAARGHAQVASRPLATAEIRRAYQAAGWEVKEYELWIFERPLAGDGAATELLTLKHRRKEMSNNNQNNDEAGDILAETDSYFVWRSDEDGEYVYHLELGGVSLHMTSEEWNELVELMKGAP